MRLLKKFPVVSTDGLTLVQSKTMAIGDIFETPLLHINKAKACVEIVTAHELGFESDCLITLNLPAGTRSVETRFYIRPVVEEVERAVVVMPRFLTANLSVIKGPFESFNMGKTIGDYQYCKWVNNSELKAMFHVPKEARFVQLFIRRWLKNGEPIQVLPFAKAAFLLPRKIIQNELGLPTLSFEEANVSLIQQLNELSDLLLSTPVPGPIEQPSSGVAKSLTKALEVYFKYFARRRSNIDSGDFDPHLIAASELFLDEIGAASVGMSLMDYHAAKGNIDTTVAIGDGIAADNLSYRRSKGLIDAQRHIDVMMAPATLGDRAAPNTEHAKSESPGIYVLHNCHPYHSGGYASRAHGLVKGFADTRTPIAPFARLGYPLDRKRVEDVKPTIELDGLTYHFKPDTTRNLLRSGFATYIDQNADYLTAAILEQKAPFIMAASFFTNGISANIAARRTGVPSIYEMRGMEWLTKMSEYDWWRKSEECKLLRELELAAAKGADMVFHITEAVRDWLLENDVDESKLVLLPNAVDDAHFKVGPRLVTDLKGQLGIAKGDTVIGYIGTHVFYEGLDVLIEAYEGLRDRGRHSLKLLLVGDGAEHKRLKLLKHRSKYADDILMPGRVSHDEVPAFYDLIDISVLARKGLPVCEMISPMKPFELFAMKKPVVSSDVAALTEIVKDGVRGSIFENGNSQSLRYTLERLIDKPKLRKKYANSAYDWVMRERTWTAVTSKGSDALSALLASFYDGKTTPYDGKTARRTFNVSRFFSSTH